MAADRKMTGEDLRMLLSKLARWDPQFREDLIKDPKSLIERQFNISLGDMTLRSVVETPDTIYIVVPPEEVPSGFQDVSEQELSTVSGGTIPLCSTTTIRSGGVINSLDRFAAGAGMGRDWGSHLFPKIPG